VAAVADGGTGGEQVAAEFNAEGGEGECHLSVGDSGGALFLQEDGVWRLAGINYSVDGPYNFQPQDPGQFDAALCDEGGLYRYDGASWTLVPDLPRPQPGNFYATRVSSHIDWINAVLALPVPAEEQLVLQSSASADGPYRDDASAVVDEGDRTVRVPCPDGTRFYRLRACQALTLRPLGVTEGVLLLGYSP
jgi:hypothetical protein